MEIRVKDSRALADYLPTLKIAAKNLATEMTNYNVEQKDLQGESDITIEHVDNNSSVREMLGQRLSRWNRRAFNKDDWQRNFLRNNNLSILLDYRYFIVICL